MIVVRFMAGKHISYVAHVSTARRPDGDGAVALSDGIFENDHLSGFQRRFARLLQELRAPLPGFPRPNGEVRVGSTSVEVTVPSFVEIGNMIVLHSYPRLMSCQVMYAVTDRDRFEQMRDWMKMFTDDAVMLASPELMVGRSSPALFGMSTLDAVLAEAAFNDLRRLKI